jgi:hypothetical protein
MIYNYLEQYNLIQILNEIYSVKTDSKTLQEFSGKFVDITKELKEASEKFAKSTDAINFDLNIDTNLLENFQDFRTGIYKLESQYNKDESLKNIIDYITKELKKLINESAKIIQILHNVNSEQEFNQLKKLLNYFLIFNNDLQKKLDNVNKNFKNDLEPIIKKWDLDINNYIKEKQKIINLSNDPEIYTNFKNGNGFIIYKYDEKNQEIYFFHENLFYKISITQLLQEHNGEYIHGISFSTDNYNVNFKEFSLNYLKKTLSYKARMLQDTQLFWTKVITVIKYCAQKNKINYFLFKGVDDDEGIKSTSAISQNKALITFRLFNKFLFANADLDSEIPAQPLIRWLQEYNKKQKNDLKFKIKELKEDFFESEITFNNKKIKSIDTLRYLKIISIIKNDKNDFEEERKTFINFIKKYNNIKKKINELNLNNLKSIELYKILLNLNEDISAILSLEGKIKNAQEKIEIFVDNLPAEKESNRLLKQKNIIQKGGQFISIIYSSNFLRGLDEIKITLISILGFSLIGYAINKERIRLSKKNKINKKQIQLNKSSVLKQINSIIFNLIKYLKILSIKIELIRSFEYIFNKIDELSPSSDSKKISKEQFKSLLLDTIYTINNKYKYTEKSENFENRLQAYMRNFKDNEQIDINNLKDENEFNFSPFWPEINYDNTLRVIQPGGLLKLTTEGKIALMNARDKRYYKLLISYGIKDKNIFFDENKQIVFSAI